MNFYGRKEETHRLYTAWQQAREGNPQWVTIVAETGTGKTRLVQEFYRQINARSLEQGVKNAKKNKSDPDNYWPDHLPIDTDQLGLNPEPEGLTAERIDSLKSIPWLWWGMRGENPGQRNLSEGGCAIRDAQVHLVTHTTILAILEKRDKSNLDAAWTCTKFLLSMLPAAGPIIKGIELGELIYSGKEPFSRMLKGYGIRLQEERKKLQITLKDQLIDDVFKFLAKDVPVILILDDAQWFDPDSIDFINGLVERTAKQKLKLMIVSTSWAREWDASEIRKAYDNFEGAKQRMRLGGIESEHTGTFLLSNFPGLSEVDQQLLLVRANGNFRYLTELVLYLKADPEMFFEGEVATNYLSAKGLRQLGEISLAMDELVTARFLKLEKRVRTALMHSSCQGVRFDPGLTALVTLAVDPKSESAQSTIDAINLAERPGSMVCTVELDLREFLQGPYWRLIRKRQLGMDKEFPALLEAYRQIVSQDDRNVTDSIVESLTVQWLEREEDPSEKIRLRARLLEAAVESGRFKAGLHQLVEIAAIIDDLRKGVGKRVKFPALSPKAALAAVRSFNQYVFGAHGDRETRRLLQKLLVRDICEILEARILHYSEDGRLPQGRNLDELIEWCEALVGFRRGLGHEFNYLNWLNRLSELYRFKTESGPAGTRTRIRYVANVLRLAEAYAPLERDKAGWDAVNDLYKRARLQVGALEGSENTIILAWWNMSKIIYFPDARGRSYYPDLEKADSDHIVWHRCKDALNDLFAEPEFERTLGEINGLEAFGDDLRESLLHASTLNLEYADSAGLPLTVDFLDRLKFVSQEVFMRIEGGGYVPTTLASKAMECNLAVARVLSKLLSEQVGVAEAKVVGIPGVEVILLCGREIAISEPLEYIREISAVGNRYRQLGMLSVDMVRVLALISEEELTLTKAGAENAAKTFNCIVDDAILVEDGERATFGEGALLLPPLIRIFDQWLANSPRAGEYLQRLLSGYSPCETWKLDRYMTNIRAGFSDRGV